jgi:hypothetical protein
VIFAFFILFPLLLAALSPSAQASINPFSLEVEINRTVGIREGGLLVVNDNVKLSPRPGESVTLQNYTLGFPYHYKSNLDYAFAYKGQDPNSSLKLELDASLGKIGFYGINVLFEPVITIEAGGSYEFTIVYVFSNAITRTASVSTITYNASFPAYPSLTQEASKVNMTIAFPVGFNFTAAWFSQEAINYTLTQADSWKYLSFSRTNLSEFSTQNGWFTFIQTTQSLGILELNGVTRNIQVGFGRIGLTDSYAVVDHTEKLSNMRISLPGGAFDISAYDEFGQISNTSLQVKPGDKITNITLTFGAPFDVDEEARFRVNYALPWKNHATTLNWNSFHISTPQLENFNWTIRTFTIKVNLPEGATLSSSQPLQSLSSLQSSTFDTSFTVDYQNVTPFNIPSFDFEYRQAVFWESFRPALWTSVIVLIISAVIGAWSIYKPSAAPLPTAMVRVRPEDLKKFVELYEERRHNQKEIESLESQARKGKIPRRLYKVRRTSIDNRLASLSRDLAGLRDKIRSAGPRYSDLMRQLEVAENELKGVEADVNRAEAGYRKGEMSAASYHELLEGSYRRRDRAQTTIAGVLLRLREEIS